MRFRHVALSLLWMLAPPAIAAAADPPASVAETKSVTDADSAAQSDLGAEGASGTEAASGTEPDSATEGASREELEKKLAETLSGATLSGLFSVRGVNEGRPVAADHYQLGVVKKLDNGRWLFRAQVRLNDREAILPLSFPVEWAGETPVIIIRGVPMPGLGTYSARVLIFDGQYAGTWREGERVGTMFGEILPPGSEVKDDPADEADTASDAEPASEKGDATKNEIKKSDTRKSQPKPDPAPPSGTKKNSEKLNSKKQAGVKPRAKPKPAAPKN
jgi:hypothetical protein